MVAAKKISQTFSLLFMLTGLSCQVSPNNANKLVDAAGSSVFVPPNPQVYQYSSCLSSSGIDSTLPAPGSGGGNEPIADPATTSLMLTQDGVFGIFECSAASSNGSQLVEYSLDVSQADLANYTSVQITWVGQAGVYSGGCNSGTPNSGSFRLDFYDGTSGTWTNIYSGSALTTSTMESQSFSVPSDYVSGGKLWVRAVANSAGGGACSSVQTDFISIALL